jgi:signal transduction histidine kinase
VLVVPAVAFLVLAGLNLSASVTNARDYGQGAAIAGFGRQVTALVDELQTERDLSAGYVASGRPKALPADPPGWDVVKQGPPPQNITNGLQKQQDAVNKALASYRDAQGKVSDSLDKLALGKVQAAGSALDSLSNLRNAVTKSKLTQSAALDQYTGMISSLLDINVEIGRKGGSAELSQSVTALNDLSRAKEAVSQVRAELYKVAFAESFELGEFQDFSGLLAEQDAAIARFRADASDTQRTLFDDEVSGQAVLTVSRIQRAAVNRQQTANLQLDPEQWFAAATTRLQLMRQVETSLLSSVVSEAQTLRDNARRSAITTGIIILVILTIAVLTSLLIARSMTRPLRRLRSSALDVAENRLPQAIQRLRGTDADTGEIGVEPIGIDTRDEIGEVARTFDAIHEVAIRLATEQAALRNNVNAMFVNLSRRSQGLVERQLKLIDELETGEQDPDQLSNLFKLDHLATRMRRNSENLLVLAGEDAGRRWGRPIPLVDVLRAATSEVEQYHRIQLTGVPDVEVMGHAVNHVVHLVAELLENATVFSSPESKVLVHSQRLSDGGAMIEIEDRGIGMTAQEISDANERLANPPVFDVSISRMMGLFVVGRLSQRHGITVRLRQSELGGVSAFVRLTNEVLANRFDQRPEPVGADSTRLPAGPGSRAGLNSQPGRLSAGPAADLPRRPLSAPGGLANGGSPSSTGTSPALPGGPALPSGPVFPALPPGPAPATASENGSAPMGGGPSGSGLNSGGLGGTSSGLPRRQPGTSGPDQMSSGPIFPPSTPPSTTGPGGLPRRPVQTGQNGPSSTQPGHPLIPQAGNGPGGPTGPGASGPGSSPFGGGQGAGQLGGSSGSPSDSPFPGPTRPGTAGPTPIMPLGGGTTGPSGPTGLAQDRFGQGDLGRGMPPGQPGGQPSQPGGQPGQPGQGGFGQSAGGPAGSGFAGAGQNGPVSNGPVGGPAGVQAGPNGPRPVDQHQPGGRDGISSAPPPANTLASSFRPAPVRSEEEIRLPIFEQLQSEWFRRRTPSNRAGAGDAGRSAARPTPPAPRPGGQPLPPQPMGRPPMASPRPTPIPPQGMPPMSQPPVSQPPMSQPPVSQPMGQPAMPPVSQPPMAQPPMAQPQMPQPQMPQQPAAAAPQRPGDPDSWQSPADEGWRAAERLLAPTTGGTTRAGLPMRVPQAHLMPGAAETPPAPAPVQPSAARSPEAVRSRLASYHQGVRRGRHADRRGDGADHDQPDVYAQTQEQT